jgi:predicted RNase H-like nuclease
MTVCAGVDGCKGGWIAVWCAEQDETPRMAVFADFATLAKELSPPAVIAVDMPIGLPDFIQSGGRGPEQAVRAHLGARRSSVFPISSRSAVYAECGPQNGLSEIVAAQRRASVTAQATSISRRKITIQAFMLFPKIREVDAYLREETGEADRIIESHPEFAFCVLNGGKPMTLPKKIKGKVNPPGMEERRELLSRHGLSASFLTSPAPKGAAADDFLDACAMLVIASRRKAGLARPNPEPLQRDSFGLPVAIWA